MKAKGAPIFWPPNPAEHLTDWLFEIGPTTGDKPITWGELRDWQVQTGITLDVWEARTIRRLSQAWLSQCHAAEEPDCPEPYSPLDDDDIEARRDHVDAQLNAFFGGLQKQSDP